MRLDAGFSVSTVTPTRSTAALPGRTASSRATTIRSLCTPCHAMRSCALDSPSLPSHMLTLTDKQLGAAIDWLCASRLFPKASANRSHRLTLGDSDEGRKSRRENANDEMNDTNAPALQPQKSRAGGPLATQTACLNYPLPVRSKPRHARDSPRGRAHGVCA